MKILLPIALAFVPVAAHADADVFGADTVTGYAEIRAVAASGETAWTRGGYGKLRFGAGDGGLHGDGALVWSPRLTDTLSLHAVAQDAPDAGTPLSLAETYVRWKPVPTSGVRYVVRFGRMLPPISLENDGVAWSATRTLTPSAIDTWVGEEMLATGAELSVETQAGDQRFGATAGVFEGADAAGSILAYRGWALHDLVTGGNAVLPVPGSAGTGYRAVFVKQAGVDRPDVEVDGRAGYYLRGDWRPPLPVALNLVYWYNPANPAIVTRGQYGWATRVFDGGLAARLDDRDELLAQAMWGATKMGGVLPDGRHPADMVFASAYVLASRALNDGTKLTLRGDVFDTRDHSYAHLYPNAEHGAAVTAAVIHPWTVHLSSAFEVTGVSSDRAARAAIGEGEHQAGTQVQVTVRVVP